MAEELLQAGAEAMESGDTAAALRAWRKAYGRLRRGPDADPVLAADAAIGIALTYEASVGNLTAAKGWLERLVRLVDEFELEPLEGWVRVLRCVLYPQDPPQVERWAREALEIARRFEDRDLELCALCEVGAALAAQGRVEEGLAALGEAVAASLGGEAERPDTIVYCCCRTIVTCSLTAEVDRAAQWIRAADAFDGGLHLHVLCRAHYGGVLFATGRWPEAEEELLKAIELSRGAERVVHAEAVARLAELRLAQGRTEEAARLLAGLGDQPAAAHARAAVQLARGEAQAAATLLARRLRHLAHSALEAAPCVELLVGAELATGAVQRATARALELSETAPDAVKAYGERALGRCLMASGQPDAATAHLEQAMELFAARELVYEAARSRLLLAESLSAARPQAAVGEARVALEELERLGAADADVAAALLRSLGVKAARSGPRGAEGLTKREAEVLALLGEGMSTRAIAERLFLSVKTVEHHVHSVLSKLDLASRAEAAAYVARAAN
jgi:DNA-binding CsgD family transcriptional regulator